MGRGTRRLARSTFAIDGGIHMNCRNPLLTGVVFVVMTAALAAQQRAEEQQRRPLPEHFTANAVSTGGARTSPVASTVDISITRWSGEAESARLLATLKEKGPEALLEAVRDAKSVGSIRTPGNLAYDLRYAHEELLGDGMRRIVLITDRPISFWEAVNRPRTIDYPFTMIELRVNNRGEGEGKLNLAARIDISRTGRTIQLENYDTQPIHLSEVRRTTR
jgi:hypothetical protein